MKEKEVFFVKQRATRHFVILEEGMKNENIYVVLSGTLSVHYSGFEDIVFTTYKCGDIFGESSYNSGVN